MPEWLQPAAHAPAATRFGECTATITPFPNVEVSDGYTAMPNGR
jgi:hypothetical protein